MSIIITAFQVLQGDSLLVTCNSATDPATNILVDAGVALSFHRTLSAAIPEIIKRGEKIDLAVITHYDNDHIQGFIPLLREFGVEHIEQFWFNYHPGTFSFPDPAGAVGVAEGIQVRDYLYKNGKLKVQDISFPHRLSLGAAMLTVLSPTETVLKSIKTDWQVEETGFVKMPEPIGSYPNDKHIPIKDLIERPFSLDREASNMASIAFKLDYLGKSVLLTGDSNPVILASSIRSLGFSEMSPLVLDLMQVPHHGSSRNTNMDLIDLIDCRNFLVSTNPINGGNRPHKASLARIITSVHRREASKPITLYFNYDHPSLRTMFTAEELEQYRIECRFPAPGQNGIQLDV